MQYVISSFLHLSEYLYIYLPHFSKCRSLPSLDSVIAIHRYLTVYLVVKKLYQDVGMISGYLPILSVSIIVETGGLN